MPNKMSRLEYNIQPILKAALAALLGAFVVVGLVWFSYEIRRAQRQERCVLAVEGAGGVALYSWESITANRTTRPSSRLRQISIAILGVELFTTVDGIDLSDTGITDDELTALLRFPCLEYLRLAGTRISDAGVEEISRVRTVRRLDLSWTDITDASVNHLAAMKQLRLLVVHGTEITPDKAAFLTTWLPDCNVVH